MAVTNRREGTGRLINSNSAGHHRGVISPQSLHSISSSVSSLPLHSSLLPLHSSHFPFASLSLFFLLTHHSLFYCAPSAPCPFSVSWPFSGHYVLFAIILLFPPCHWLSDVAASPLNPRPGVFNSRRRQLPEAPLIHRIFLLLFSTVAVIMQISPVWA